MNQTFSFELNQKKNFFQKINFDSTLKNVTDVNVIKCFQKEVGII